MQNAGPNLRALCVIVAIIASGCSYGPEHLDDLYAERSRVQGIIEGIERQYRIASRDPELQRQRMERHAADLAAIRARQERERVGQEEARRTAQAERELLAKAAAEEAAFLASLSPEQRLQWMVHQEQMAALRRQEQLEKERIAAQRTMLKETLEQQDRESRRRVILGEKQRIEIEHVPSPYAPTAGEIMLQQQRR
ncbi:MAG: hypothetical protein HY721_10485 [Planctomycetes bacterium]|nr:hypothetical protein [Planctomycetota bacterium]